MPKRFVKYITDNEDMSPVDQTNYFILGNKRICALINIEGAVSNDKWNSKILYLIDISSCI